MRKPLAKRSAGRRAFQSEFLEPRALRTAGVSTASNVILDLGAVSLPAASRGVEVTASIDAGSSVTFQFRAEAAGYYALRVRHTGEGLTLEARGPSGNASIDPGPPGPFETLTLPILKASYQIQASATADQPVFVDWELLLISGVGQAPALSTALLTPLVSPPPPGPPPPAGVVSPNPTATPGPPPSPLPGPVCTASTIGLNGPIGQPAVDHPIAPVGPSTPDGSPSMAFHGEGVPSGLSLSHASRRSADGDPAAVASSTVSRDVLELADSDEAVLNGASRWERLALAMLPPISEGTPTVDDPVEPVDLKTPTSEDQPTETAGLGSEMAIGLVATILISRRWVTKADKKHPSRRDRPWSKRDEDRTWKY